MDPRDGFRGCGQAAASHVPETRYLQLVGAGPRDHVDDSAQRGAVLGLIAADLQLHGLDEVVRQCRPAPAPVDVGDVDALDVIGVLESRAAGHVHGIPEEARVGVWEELYDRLVVAVGRELAELARAQGHADGRSSRID